MSYWAEDPELYLHKGKDGVVHVLRCKKETMTSSSSSMLMKPEDFTDEGAVTDLRSLTGGSCDWNKNKYEALIDYIYQRHLLVNCHGSVIVELEPDEKNNKAAEIVYMRALDILDMGIYGPGLDHPGKAVPVKTVKYLQDGSVVQTEPTPKEMKLSKEVETLRQELLLAKETIEADLAKQIKLSKEVETLRHELLLAKEQIELELAKEMKLSKEVESLRHKLLLAEERIEAELAKEMKLSKEVETLRHKLLLAEETIEADLAKEMNLSKEVEILRHKLLLAEERIEAELAKEMNLSKEVEILRHKLLLAEERIEAELAKEMKLSKEVETLRHKLLLAEETIEAELAKEMKLSKEVETLRQQLERLLKENTVRIYPKGATSCSLTVRNGNVVLGYTDNSDYCQYWVKDDKYSGGAKDHWGFPGYALVNKSTGQALKPTDASTVELVPYNPKVLDKSILWTEQEQGDGYRAIRKLTNPALNLDAANPTNSGIGDGTMAILFNWLGGDNQKWDIVSY